MTRTLTTALLAMTALTPAAFAQSDANDMQPETQACIDLLALVEAGDLDGDRMSRDDLVAIVEYDDARTCTDAIRVASGEVSRREGDATFDADATARLRVVVPDPEVTVTQQAPQVTVDQPDPEVAVTPGRPIVTVNQAEPVVRVQMTPPVITIDMPKPTITVEMPDPSVDVAMAQPRVTVDQPAPRVQVEQGEVQVEVGDSQTTPAGETEPQVQVEQEDPRITLRASDGAEVRVGETTPDVRYNAAEPRVEFEQGGDPEIRFTQSGEADVRFRQLSAADVRDAAAREGMGAADTASDDRMAATGEADGDRQFSVVDRRAQPTGGTRESFRLDQLDDMTVIGADGETIGDVEKFVWYDENAYMIVGNGGFLGFGEKQVALPLAGMHVADGRIVMENITEDQVASMRDIDADRFRDIGMDEEVTVRVQ